MKRFSSFPLLCAFVVACSAPTTLSTHTTVTSAMAASAKTYRVVPSGQPGLPAAAIAALKKVRLAPPRQTPKISAKPRVTLLTSRGPITLELNTKAAPLHVRSFLYLSRRGFYNGTRFHRFADLLGNGQGNIIQGGDPLSKNTTTREFAGIGGPGYEVPRERNNLKHEKLVIAAARSSDPDSAGSQFYITQNPVKFLDEGDGYTVFGKVVKGQDAALKLRQGDVIKSIKIEK